MAAAVVLVVSHDRGVDVVHVPHPRRLGVAGRERLSRQRLLPDHVGHLPSDLARLSSRLGHRRRARRRPAAPDASPAGPSLGGPDDRLGPRAGLQGQRRAGLPHDLGALLHGRARVRALQPGHRLRRVGQHLWRPDLLLVRLLHLPVHQGPLLPLDARPQSLGQPRVGLLLGNGALSASVRLGRQGLYQLSIRHDGLGHDAHLLRLQAARAGRYH